MGATHGLLDRAELLELLTESVLIRVPGQATEVSVSQLFIGVFAVVWKELTR